jgi:hypothetical protein
LPKKSARPFANLKQHSCNREADMVTADGEDYPDDRSSALLPL